MQFTKSRKFSGFNVDPTDSMYQENILDHYKNPRNFGSIENASIHHQEYNPLCGDKLDMFLIIDENKKIVDVKIHANGCAISVASASMLTEEIKGKNIDELKNLTKEKILEMLGIPVSPVRLKCALLSLDTLKNSIFIFEKYVGK